MFKSKKLVFFNPAGEDTVSLKLAAQEHISNINILMYSSNGNNPNYNIQKSTYILFKDIVILDYRKPETDSKSATRSAFRHHYQLFFSFLYECFKKNIRKLQDESLLAARGHIAAISSVRRHYNNTHMPKY